MMIWHKLLWQKTMSLDMYGEQPVQRNSVDQYILMADLANTDTAKVIQPQVEDVQVKEPESLKNVQIVVKIKNCLEEKYNDHQFNFSFF